jgi:hypothetical protein
VTVQKHRYPAFSMKQTIDSKPLVLFSAPATDIAAWVGVPQRGRLDGGETVGFQRQENPARVKELANFFTEPRNVVQNPLLCALQADHDVTFVFDDEEAGFGHIEILQEDLESLTLLDLIERVIFRLETRVPNLTGVSLDQERLTEVVRRASEAGFTAKTP